MSTSIYWKLLEIKYFMFLQWKGYYRIDTLYIQGKYDGTKTNLQSIYFAVSQFKSTICFDRKYSWTAVKPLTCFR